MPKKKFTNLDNKDVIMTWREYRKWKRETKNLKKDYSNHLSKALDVDTQFLRANRTETTITWIGHATFLIQLGGLNIVTDPVWASRMGFKRRLVPPGMPLQEMPEIDLVLISHAHYDHLHYSSLYKLKGDPLFLVPEGLKTKFMKKKLTKVKEFEWWEKYKYENLSLTFVPAQHWTRRGLTDINNSHWGGWIIECEEMPTGETIYFAGDSGYFNGFTEIGNHFNIDYALMPIGAYDPEWFMSEHHVSPEEAVKAFIDVQADVFIPMHYGTFRMADDTAEEAILRLKTTWDNQKLDFSSLKLLDIGETVIS
jgi:L-ascorbate metabolism protein UlaG (beta-lactamase superfamily)